MGLSQGKRENGEGFRAWVAVFESFWEDEEGRR